MPITYNIPLVLVSALIAILAAHITLEGSGRVSTTTGTTRTFWLITGAIAMGSGIWSMHFVAMLAFSIPISITYHLPTVFLSLVVPILAAFQAFSIVSRPKPNTRSILIGSIMIGLGIAMMHYLGMAAMQMPATLRYNPLLLLLSVLIAIVVSWVALMLAISFRQAQQSKKKLKLLSATVMGAAVSSMHYTGMAAAIFTANPSKLAPPSGLDNVALALIVCLYTLFVMGFTLAMMHIEPKTKLGNDSRTQPTHELKSESKH